MTQKGDGMIYDYLQKKINDSYETLRLAADISKEYYQKPLIITYSGGKDSDVLLQLAIECLKSEEFEVLNSHTTLDAPETVYYIKDRFKELAEMGIKATVHYPHYPDGRPMSIWSLIIDKQIPPTRLARYCCKYLKETTNPNRFVAVGVREAESIGRRGRDAFSSRGTTKAEHFSYSVEHIKEVFEDDKARRSDGGVTNPNEVGVYDCIFVQKAKQNEDLICNPIYKWLDTEVWEFIHDREMKYNPLYDKGFTRVGCLGCPLSTKQVQELEMYPKYKEQFIRTFDKLLKIRKENGKDDSKGYWTDAESLYKWWVQDDSIPGQMDIFDFIDKEE